MTGIRREVVIAPQESGWAVITRYYSGKWAGQESIYYCRWLWQARREAARQDRKAIQ